MSENSYANKRAAYERVCYQGTWKRCADATGRAVHSWLQKCKKRKKENSCLMRICFSSQYIVEAQKDTLLYVYIEKGMYIFNYSFVAALFKKV